MDQIEKEQLDKVLTYVKRMKLEKAEAFLKDAIQSKAKNEVSAEDQMRSIRYKLKEIRQRVIQAHKAQKELKDAQKHMDRSIAKYQNVSEFHDLSASLLLKMRKNRSLINELCRERVNLSDALVCLKR